MVRLPDAVANQERPSSRGDACNRRTPPRSRCMANVVPSPAARLRGARTQSCAPHGSCSTFGRLHGSTMPMKAAVGEAVTEIIHGMKIEDPYRWLEERASVETEAWIEAQHQRQDGYFAKISEL